MTERELALEIRLRPNEARNRLDPLRRPGDRENDLVVRHGQSPVQITDRGVACLFRFAEQVQTMRGWGRGLRRAVAGWYLARPVDEIAYQAVKAIHENHTRLLSSTASASETVPQNGVKNTFLPFHPGAVRYYREVGINIPDTLIPTH